MAPERSEGPVKQNGWYGRHDEGFGKQDGWVDGQAQEMG